MSNDKLPVRQQNKLDEIVQRRYNIIRQSVANACKDDSTDPLPMPLDRWGKFEAPSKYPGKISAKIRRLHTLYNEIKAELDEINDDRNMEKQSIEAVIRKLEQRLYLAQDEHLTKTAFAVRENQVQPLLDSLPTGDTIAAWAKELGIKFDKNKLPYVQNVKLLSTDGK